MSSGETKRRRPRRRWLIRLLALSIVPGLVLGTELVLRLAGVGYSTAFFVRHGDDSVYTRNLKYGWRFFPRSMATTPEVFRVPVEKPEETFRVFVMGGSAALGTPDASYGLSRVLQALLDGLYPPGRVEVVGTAMAAINSHVVLEIAGECAELDPDLFVVYLGNNEVIGPFGAGTIFAGYSASRSSIRTGLWIKSTRLGQLYDSFGQSDAGFEVWRGMEMFYEHHVPADDPRLERVYSHFRANLEDICDLASRSGAETVLCTVGTNLRDCPPFGSRHRTDLAAADEATWQQLYDRGVEAEAAGDWERALELFREAEEFDDRYADLSFRSARCLRALDRMEEAKAAFVRARDLDTLRFRADSSINAIIRELAAERSDRGVHLVDAEAAFETSPATPDGIPGFEHFWEHVHLGFSGNYLLARAILPQIEALLPTELREAKRANVEVPSYEECAARLVFTEWDLADQTETILSMVKRPPFIGQIDHDQHRASLQRDVKSFRGGAKQEAQREAVRLYLDAVERYPDDWHLLFSLANLHNERGTAGAALELFERLVDMFPHEIAYRQSLSRVLFAIDRDEEALEQLRIGLEIDPGNPDVNTTLGNYYADQGEAGKALEHFLVSLERRPGHRAHNFAGLVFFQREQFEEAREHFEQALRVEPDFTPAQAHLALLLVTQGDATDQDLQRARDLAERACELTDYAELDHVDTLATVLRELGDTRRIVEVFDAAIEAAKTDGRTEDLALARARRQAIEAELERKRRGRRAANLIRRIGAQLGLDAAEIKSRQGLPLDERLRALDELGRRFVIQRVTDDGLPAGLSAGEWEAWSELSDEEFFERAAEFGLFPGSAAPESDDGGDSGL